MLLRYCEACGMTLGPTTGQAIAAAPQRMPLPEPPAPRPQPGEDASLPASPKIAGEGAADHDALDASVASIAPRATSSKRRWMARIGLVILVTAAGTGIALRSRSQRLPDGMGEAHSLLRAASTASPSPAPVSVSGLSVAAARPSIPLGMGLLNTTNAAPGHRIFVDGRTVGQTPQSVLVKCGRAAVKIGSAGHWRVLDLPCGKETRVDR
jgi:hypothetical protein